MILTTHGKYCIHRLCSRSSPLAAVKSVSGKPPLQQLYTKGSGMAERNAFLRNTYSSGRSGSGGSRGGARGGGRGEYYKNRYGRGGRGEGPTDVPSSSNAIGGTFSTFLDLLDSLDGKQYGGYRSIETAQGWVHDNFILRIMRAQSDPFASPTRCQIEISAAFAQFPTALYANKLRSVALADYLHRALHAKALEIGADAALAGKGWGGPKGGDIQILEPCQHVLEQSAVVVNNGTIVVQLTINLPARGRTILGKAARQIFGQNLSTLLQTTLKYELLNPTHIESHVNSVEDQVWLQRQLDDHGLVAFVRDGAILPRASGVDDRPLLGGVPFESPPSFRLKFQLPSTGGIITGMGFQKGISLICGGGFHGKSTLLEALQFGVYPKLPGDGREFCVTSISSAKIRAEDGRSVNAVDISPFISNLPFGKDTTCFHSVDASGSTSQASSILEAIEMGTNLLLFDEDTCATNFMIRDQKMMQLVSTDKEPITPFVHKVRSLFEDHSVSSILVIGGSGDYFAVADSVVIMDSYKCFDVTARAKEIAGPDEALSLPFGRVETRRPICSLFKADGKVAVRSMKSISYGDIELDTSGLEQLVSKSQTSAIAQAFQTISSFRSGISLQECLLQLDQMLDEQGVDVLAPGLYHGGLSRTRSIDVAAAMNRFRKDGAMKQK